MRPATKRKKRRKTYGRRRVGAGIRLLAVSPILGELAVGDVVHHDRHLCMRHLPGAQPARVEAAAHLANHVRPALERKYSALHEGGHQVGSGQALRLDHHPEPGDGCVPGLRQRPGTVAPRRWPPSRPRSSLPTRSSPEAGRRRRSRPETAIGIGNSMRAASQPAGRLRKPAG